MVNVTLSGPTGPGGLEPTGETRPNWREAPVGWAVSKELVDYPEAVAAMEARAAAIAAGEASELVWLLEHPPLYTAGTSADPADLIDGARFPVHKTARGGQFTYHGPGQRVMYLMLNLKTRTQDLRRFIRDLEGMIIDALGALGVDAERRDGRVGVWVAPADGAEAKIAAIGVRVRRWVSFHGISVNVAPDLEHFAGIVPCGIRDFGVTSLAALGRAASMEQVDRALQSAFTERFGPVEAAPAPEPATSN